MDPKIIFRDVDHSYWMGTGGIEGRTRMRSVNTLWGRYFEPFDREFVISTNALAAIIGHNKFWRSYMPNKWNITTHEDLRNKYGKYMDGLFYELRELIRLEWDYGNVMGTEIHEVFEGEAYSLGYVINPFDGKKYITRDIPKKYDNQSVVDNLWDLEDGCYPELVVWHEASRSCGQIDVPMIETIDGVRYFDLLDFKSNGGIDEETGLKKRKEISKPSKQKRDKKYIMGTGVLSKVYDCGKYTQYQGQLSMYAALLEEAGFICRNIGVGHLLEYNPNTLSIIKYPYLEKEAKAVLKDNS